MTHRQDQGQPYRQQWPPAGQQPPWPQQGYGQQAPPQQFVPYGQPSGTTPQQYRPRRARRHIVRNVLAAIGAGVVAIIVVAVAASAGHHAIQNTGTGGTGTGGKTGGGQAHASAPAAETAHIGTAITLAGNDSGEQVTVTVTKVIADARGSDEFSQAPAGKRLYAVQFRLRDTGSEAYSDSPANGAAVTDTKGQSYQSSFETVNGCQEFPGTENIATGASGLGCIVFEVPKSAKIKQVQFTLDSGFGPQTGQWDVKS